MAMVPLPQFQAQRPEAVGSQVINAAPRYNSFWGTVAPNLLQLAGGVRNMIEGDPGVRMQERQYSGLETERTANQLKSGENQQANEAYLDAQIAAAQQRGDDAKVAELQVLRARAGDFVSYKNRAAGEQYRHMKAADDSITQANQIDPNLRGKKPGNPATADQLLESGMQVRGDGQAQNSPPPTQDNLTADAMGIKMPPAPPQTFPSQTGETIRDLPPPQAPGEPLPASTGPGQPLPPNATGAGTGPQAAAPGPPPTAQDHLYDIAAGLQTTPENLHINSEGQVIPSPDLVMAGKAKPGDAVPLPPQGSISPEQARYSESVGQQLANLKRKAVQDTYLARAWGDIVLGKDVSDAGLAAMDLNDARTEQAIKGAQYNLGINADGLNFNNVQKLAIWMNMTQDQIRNISLGDEATKEAFRAEFGDMIQAYNTLPVNARIAMQKFANEIAKDQGSRQKNQLEYEAKKAQVEAKKLADNERAARDEAKLVIAERDAATREKRAEQAGMALEDIMRHRVVQEGQGQQKVDQQGKKIEQGDRKLDQGDRRLTQNDKKIDQQGKLNAARIDRWTFQNSNDAARTKVFQEKLAWLKDPKNPQVSRNAASSSMAEQKASNNYINSAVAANGVVTRGLKPRRPGDMEYPDMFVRDHYNTLLQMKRDEAAKSGKVADIGQPQALHATTQALLHTLYQAAVDKNVKKLAPLADANYDWGKLAGQGLPPEELVTLHKAAEYYHSRAKGF